MTNKQPSDNEALPPIGELNFDNTEIAFKSKTDAELNRAYWLFKIIASNFLVKVGPPITNFALRAGLPVKGLIKKTIFNHFCGGESIAGCKPMIASLARQKVGTILDYSAEGEDSEADFDKTYQEVLKTIEYAVKHPKEMPFAVFKPTGVGRFELYEKLDAGMALTPEETVELEHVKARFDGICKACHEHDIPVLIDAEHSWIQDSIDDIVRELMRKYNKEKAIVFNTYQLYRHDKLASLKADYHLAETDGFYLGAKLVRGAYMEIERERAEKNGYASPIQPDQAATNRDYNAAMLFCLDHLDRVSFMAGTHNEESSRLLAEEMEKRGIARNLPHVYFAQLLAMSDHLTFNLAAHGFNSAKYMPFGPVKLVMPYLFRRAQENTSVAGQTGRELSLIQKEKARRKI